MTMRFLGSRAGFSLWQIQKVARRVMVCSDELFAIGREHHIPNKEMPINWKFERAQLFAGGCLPNFYNIVLTGGGKTFAVRRHGQGANGNAMSLPSLDSFRWLAGPSEFGQIPDFDIALGIGGDERLFIRRHHQIHDRLLMGGEIAIRQGLLLSHIPDAYTAALFQSQGGKPAIGAEG